MNSKWGKRIRYLGIMLAIGIFILAACAPAAMPTQQSRDVYESEMPAEAPAPAAPALELNSGAVQDVSLQTQERLVIKNANMTIIVPDPSVSMNNISRMAEGMGGFVVSANMYKQTLSDGIEVPRASITIRVPSEMLNQALENIRGESNQDPENETLSSQDVTSEYVDLQSRLNNLEAAEAELTRIMEDANRTEDVLAVYNELVSIREQIEVIKGQIKYYEQSAALSAISVELIADQAVQPIEIGGWKPEGVVKNAIEALVRAMQGLVNALIWIVLFLLPVLLVLGLIFVVPPVLIIRAWRNRRKKRKLEKQPENPQI